ncbi:CAP domain-containing protein [Streptomyces sp. S3(2020)]|nr:CAP domain-containing protein [Streptomyces sp. S3(2020)]NNN34451.1 CAP domain-containing protein [Streptomyces sp. S3(2020)]
MSKHRQKSKRRKIAGAAVAVVVAGAVGVPAVAQASGNGLGGWRVVSFPWWGWGKSDPVADPTPSGSPVASASASGTSATSAPSGTPSASASSASPSASPSPSGSPSATPTADASGESASPSASPKATASSSTPSASASTADPGPTDRVLVLVNAEREKAGCAPLTENAKLTKAAQDHSQDMADHENMSHTGSDGSSMSDRLSRVGYAFRSAGENVAYGYSTPESVMDAWMNSSGHRANILNCGFKEIGIGLAQPGHYWTQDFGSAA